MKIILDDIRKIPKGNYNCVRSYEDCILLLKIFKDIDFISLDYHLGIESRHTGLDVLVYMNENGIQPKQVQQGILLNNMQN